jgi:hypothetical protein
MECIEDEVIKPKYRSISGNVRLRCNDCGKETEAFLRHKIVRFVGASPSFRFHHPDNEQFACYELKSADTGLVSFPGF